MTRSNLPPRISRASSSPLASSGVAIWTSALLLAVGDIELERLVALGRKLERNRIDQLALAAGLVGGMAIELGLGLHPLGAEVVDPAEELIDVGLLVIDPSLKGDDGHVVRGILNLGLGVRRARRFGGKRRRVGAGR